VTLPLPASDKLRDRVNNHRLFLPRPRAGFPVRGRPVLGGWPGDSAGGPAPGIWTVCDIPI